MQKKKKVKNKTVTLEYQNKKYEGQYTGLMKNDKPTKGTFSYKKGDDYLAYKGIISNGKMSGEGTLDTNLMTAYFIEKKCEGRYKGIVSGGKASKKGRFEFVSPKDFKNAVYQGSWHANMANGKGRLDFSVGGKWAMTGHFDTGYFDPTTFKIYQTMGTFEEIEYKISPKAKTFIEKNDSLFMAKKETDLTPYVDSSLSHHDVLKKSGDYGDELMKFSDYTVLNTELNEKVFGRNLSLVLLGLPSENSYIYVICLDPLKDVSFNSTQTVY